MASLIMRLLGFTESYCEVFAGGASVGLTISRRWPWTRCRFNDSDPAVAGFHTVLRDYPGDLYRKVKSVWRDFSGVQDLIEFYQAIRPILRTSRLDKLDRAVAFYICNRIGYSGITCRVAGTTADLDSRLNEGLIDTLPYWSSVLNGVEITNLDYRVVVDQITSDHAVFIDSPYEHYVGGPNVDLYWSEPWQRADILELADHLLDLDHRRVRWVTTLIMSPPTEGMFIDILRSGSNSIRMYKLPVRHRLVHRAAEELVLWNFDAR
ncbi:protein of unknown function [Magnetospirillum sp. XM-1]|nr:protein of unknown function [Magnetospirillum sp. XM-1]